MNVDELRQLDFNNMADAPASVRYFLVVVVFIAILIVGYFLRVKGQVETLDRERATEQTLRDEFEDKAKRAINLPAYEQQLAEMEALLRALIRQLPSKTEMPDLLVDVSQTALAAGITNELFEPGSETIQGFYAEQPISIRMVGTYHQFGTFISGVASLPRVVILTMHDISLQPAGSESAGQLAMEGTVKTYRYLDEDELAEAAPTPQGGR
jgi:type IV pilus assembly protein PilO